MNRERRFEEPGVDDSVERALVAEARDPDPFRPEADDSDAGAAVEIRARRCRKHKRVRSVAIPFPGRHHLVERRLGLLYSHAPPADDSQHCPRIGGERGSGENDPPVSVRKDREASSAERAHQPQDPVLPGGTDPQ